MENNKQQNHLSREEPDVTISSRLFPTSRIPTRPLGHDLFLSPFDAAILSKRKRGPSAQELIGARAFVLEQSARHSRRFSSSLRSVCTAAACHKRTSASAGLEQYEVASSWEFCSVVPSPQDFPMSELALIIIPHSFQRNNSTCMCGMLLRR